MIFAMNALLLAFLFVLVIRSSDAWAGLFELIAHSVGVAEPRLMRRRYVRFVQADGSSFPMNKNRPSYNPGTDM